MHLQLQVRNLSYDTEAVVNAAEKLGKQVLRGNTDQTPSGGRSLQQSAAKGDSQVRISRVSLLIEEADKDRSGNSLLSIVFASVILVPGSAHLQHL